MKFVIATLAIAALAQLAMAGPIARQKRSEEFTKVFLESLQTLKTYSPRAEKFARDMLKDIPSTDGYSKYIELFEKYLEAAGGLKSISENCFQKSLTGMSMITDLLFSIDILTVIHETPESEEVTRLVKVHGGETLNADLKNFSKTLKQFDVQNELQNLTESESSRINPLMTEVC